MCSDSVCKHFVWNGIWNLYETLEARNLESYTRFLGGDPSELGSFLKCIPAIVHRDLTTGCFSMGGNFDF